MIDMKKGFLFTIVFSLFFIMLLYAAVEYLNILQSRQATLGADNPVAEAYIADDVGNDYLSIFGMKTSVARGNMVYWTVEDKPGEEGNIAGRIASYEQFISGEYSNATNANATVEIDRSGTLSLEPAGITYSHPSESEISVDGKAEEYSISARLADSCGGCSPSGNWAWGNEGDGPMVSLDLIDSNGTRVGTFGKASGYIRANETSTLILQLSGGGSFELRITGGQMRMALSGSGAETKTTIGISGGSESKVYAPVRLTLGKRVFSRIPLIEK